MIRKADIPEQKYWNSINFALQISYKQNYIFSISPVCLSILEICLPFQFEWQEHAVELGSQQKLPSTSKGQIFLYL